MHLETSATTADIARGQGAVSLLNYCSPPWLAGHAYRHACVAGLSLFGTIFEMAPASISSQLGARPYKPSHHSIAAATSPDKHHQSRNELHLTTSLPVTDCVLHSHIASRASFFIDNTESRY